MSKEDCLNSAQILAEPECEENLGPWGNVKGRRLFAAAWLGLVDNAGERSDEDELALIGFWREKWDGYNVFKTELAGANGNKREIEKTVDRYERAVQRMAVGRGLDLGVLDLELSRFGDEQTLIDQVIASAESVCLQLAQARLDSLLRYEKRTNGLGDKDVGRRNGRVGK